MTKQKKKDKINWHDYVSIIILLAISAIGFYNIQKCSCDINKEYIEGVEYKDTFVQGYSMFPTIRPQDRVYMIKYENDMDLFVNDMIVFQWNETTKALHRIVGMYEHYNITYYITKGDNNLLVDSPPITNQNISYVVYRVDYNLKNKGVNTTWQHLEIQE